jgi:hypothetical protein
MNSVTTPMTSYSLKDSFYLNAFGDNVLGGKLLPGQINVTQQQFEDISVAAVTELWSKFGNLNEIWFDGGISSRIRDRIVGLLTKLQPDAVTFGGGIINSKNAVDWVGTESALPNYPIWSTGCAAPGGASPGQSPGTNPSQFCPKGSDTTLQSPDVWFWMPNIPIKSMALLIKMYHATVGSNSVMELDFAIDRTGNIDPTHAIRYSVYLLLASAVFACGRMEMHACCLSHAARETLHPTFLGLVNAIRC